MKTNSFLLSITFLMWLFGTVACAQDETNRPTGSVHSHPRLLLFENEEGAIRQTCEADAAWKGINDFIISESNRILSLAPVERVLIGRRLLDKSREALRRIFYLSYAWRMTSQESYLRRAEKELLAVCSFTDWNPSHFLDVAEMTMAAAIGYDWLYKALPESSRITIREAIIEKGLKPSLESKYNSWLKASHNWNQVCNAGMTYGAIAIYEDQPLLAQQIIDRASVSIRLPMEDYQPDGAYPEGYGYWGYGTSFNVMFLSAMEKLFGQGAVPVLNEGFLKTAGYLENMTGPTGASFNYSDSGTGGSMHPAMFWFAGRLNDPSLLWSDRYFLLNRKPPNDRLLPAVLLWSAGVTMQGITPPGPGIWTGKGKNPVALMRSSWTDPDAIYLAVKGGSPSVNHSHMDIGSFIMEARGVRWAMDFGSQDYNSLESAGVNLWSMAQNSQRWQVFRYNNFVHNTITVNDQLQTVSGYAPLVSASGERQVMNAVFDLTPVYGDQLRKALRGATIVEGRYVLIRDELEAPAAETSVRWNLLTAAEVNITGNNTAVLTRDGKKLTIKVLEPSGVQLTTRSTVSQNSYDAPNPGTIMIGFTVKVPERSRVSLSVVLLPEGEKEDPEITSRYLMNWPVDSAGK